MPAFERYQELQRYVGWTADDALRVAAVGPAIMHSFEALIDDFYAEIERHPEARKVITGGAEQIARLKQTLHGWLGELFSGRYDQLYVERRWRVGYRHVEIGLDQVFTNAALSRLRSGLLRAIEAAWTGDAAELLAARSSLNTLLDLDLAIIEDAYQSEYQRREAQKQRLRALFEHGLDGFIIFTSDEVIVDANPAACAMLGLERSELCGQKLRQLLDPAISASAAAVGSFFSGQSQAGACRLRRGNGLAIDVEHRTTFNFSPGLNALSLRDVTERKRAEQRALQAERLAAIGETMTALVHESRNALQRSYACLEMLALEVEDRPAALDLVTRTLRAQEQLRHLYEEVRQWAAPVNVQREKADLSTIWREAWQQVMQVQKKMVSLREDLDCAPVGMVDRSMLEQVFRNIFENAVEVSSEQGIVELRCASGESSGGRHWRITIRDAGPGLSAEQQTRLFEPFFTTKSKGTGLGMAIAQRIIHAHEGEINASSPQGAQIEIILPKAPK